MARSDSPVAILSKQIFPLPCAPPGSNNQRPAQTGSPDIIPLVSAANPTASFPFQSYDEKGRPKSLLTEDYMPPEGTQTISVSTSLELKKAFENARPGHIITLLPGEYRVSGGSLKTRTAGTQLAPIYVRASRLGSAVVLIDTIQGFHVIQPYWVFENLNVIGDCDPQAKCEHAFHVTGAGKAFVLRNSTIRDFNAAIKVNGIYQVGEALWPDHGLIEYNAIFNSSPRQTDLPVTLINIDSVNHWLVKSNYIADFSKTKGNRVAYGAYMKGNGHSGIFERNLVICEQALQADAGVRIGLSFGGGGTGKKYCREKDCSTEHSGGIMRNNIVLNCSRDVGMYLYRSTSTQIHNNLLHNNLGIDIRGSGSSANVVSNLISGRVRERDGGKLTKIQNNLIDSNCFGYSRTNCSFDKLFADPDNTSFQLIAPSKSEIPHAVTSPGVKEDFCGNPLPRDTIAGPIQVDSSLNCLKP